MRSVKQMQAGFEHNQRHREAGWHRAGLDSEAMEIMRMRGIHQMQKQGIPRAKQLYNQASKDLVRQRKAQRTLKARKARQYEDPIQRSQRLRARFEGRGMSRAEANAAIFDRTLFGMKQMQKKQAAGRL